MSSVELTQILINFWASVVLETSKEVIVVFSSMESKTSCEVSISFETFLSPHSIHLNENLLQLWRINLEYVHFWMPKREALSTRPKVQTSDGVCSEGVDPLQAVMKNLIALAIGPKMPKSSLSFHFPLTWSPRLCSPGRPCSGPP